MQHKKNEEKDKRRSAIFTLLISLVLFLGMFFYKFTRITEKPEQITTMLINFGDNRDGAEVEEPANQDGSLAANTEVTPETKPAPVKEKVNQLEKEKTITVKKKTVNPRKPKKV